MRISRHILFLSVLCFTVMPRIACAQSVPEEARRHMVRGQAAVEMAKSTADYEAAARELEMAKQLAPQWSEVYHDLGLLYEKTGNYDGAIENLRGYLKLVPSSPDAAKVQETIYKLEYKRDRNNIEGIWKTVVNETSVTCDPGGYQTGRGAWLSSVFVIDDLVLEFRKNPEGDKVRVLSSWLRVPNLPDATYVPVKRDGETIKIFGATMYTCTDAVQPDHCPWQGTFVLTQVSADVLEGSLDVTGAGWHRVSWSKEKDEYTSFQCKGKIVLRRK
jgi:hypothetical protein